MVTTTTTTEKTTKQKRKNGNQEDVNTTPSNPRRVNKTASSYVNVNRAKASYKDKYKRDVEKALKKYRLELGKDENYALTNTEWMDFFKKILIPLDKDSEKRMIELFRGDRDELNRLLILHNTKASNNLAEVYFKKYEKTSPTKWYDIDDFRQMALEGLSIAAQRFNLDNGNRFITYATWWILNKVRKPYQEKGALVGHSSLDAAVAKDSDENPTTLEEILSPDMLANGWKCSMMDENVNPAMIMERQNVDVNLSLCSAIKELKSMDIAEGNEKVQAIDFRKTNEMMDYLTSIVDGKSSGQKHTQSQTDRQIFLYLFKKIFSKCSAAMPSLSTKLTPYIEDAAKSKAELLRRINMDERQYEKTCQSLMKRNYNGI